MCAKNILNEKPKKMDEICTTFEADYEQDWLSSSEFENMFASVNNLTDNVSTSSLNDQKIGDFIEQNKNTNTAEKNPKSDLKCQEMLLQHLLLVPCSITAALFCPQSLQILQ